MKIRSAPNICRALVSRENTPGPFCSNLDICSMGQTIKHTSLFFWFLLHLHSTANMQPLPLSTLRNAIGMHACHHGTRNASHCHVEAATMVSTRCLWSLHQDKLPTSGTYRRRKAFKKLLKAFERSPFKVAPVKGLKRIFNAPELENTCF